MFATISAADAHLRAQFFLRSNFCVPFFWINMREISQGLLAAGQHGVNFILNNEQQGVWGGVH